MARRDLDGLVAQFHGDANQEAVREALLVPWSRLHQASDAYVEWHAFLLWVRAIGETAEDFLKSSGPPWSASAPAFWTPTAALCRLPDWSALEEWIAAHRFGEAKAEGWFAALTYYAKSDLRGEQTWTHWDQTAAEWIRHRPERWPTFEEWTAAVAAIHYTDAGWVGASPCPVGMAASRRAGCRTPSRTYWNPGPARSGWIACPGLATTLAVSDGANCAGASLRSDGIRSGTDVGPAPLLAAGANGGRPLAQDCPRGGLDLRVAIPGSPPPSLSPAHPLQGTLPGCVVGEPPALLSIIR